MDSQESGTSIKCFSMEELLLHDDDASFVSEGCVSEDTILRTYISVPSHFEVLNVWFFADFVF